MNTDTADTTTTTTQPRKYPPWNYCRTCTLTFQFPADDTGDRTNNGDRTGNGDRTNNGDGCPGCCSLDYLDIQTANDTPDFWGKVMKP